MDQIGPITKDVHDAALLMNVLSGHDPMDSTSIDRAVPDYTKSLTHDVKGLKIGVPKEYFSGAIDPAVADAVRAAIAQLVSMGAVAEEISLPHTEYACRPTISSPPAEASSNLAPLRRRPLRPPGRRRATNAVDLFEKTREEGFGPEVKQRIMIGTYALSAGYYDAFYVKAQKVRTLIKRDFDEAFTHCDVIIAPTAPTVAFKIGEVSDPLVMKQNDILTIPANMAGIPAISLPCGFSHGLPIGLQIMAPAFGEEVLLRTAYAYEQANDWHTARAMIERPSHIHVE